ncbi:MAG: class E sortase [Actinomycetota bacterium]|nr:class E sortase [Actinomycetota bacterium]
MRPARSLIRFIVVFGLIFGMFAAMPAIATPSEDATPASARQPASHRSQRSGVIVSRIRVPAIGLDEIIRSGIDLSVIDRGVAHWAGTSSPGEAGNVVLAGHRSTHSRPFWNLDLLEEGDLIYVEDGAGFEVMYTVSDSFVVEPDELWISYDQGRPMVTLFACHPKGSARYRIVVQADLVAGRRVA